MLVIDPDRLRPLGVLTIWQLYVVGFVNGVLTVFFDVADQSYLPSILERDELVEGNSKLQISQSAAHDPRPAIGGGIVALLTAPIAVLVDAVSYLGSAALIVSIRERARDVVAGRRPASPIDAVDATEADQVSAGTSAARRWPWRRPSTIRARPSRTRRRAACARRSSTASASSLRHEYLGNIAATTGTSNLFSNIGGAIFPVYAYRTLGLTPEAVGRDRRTRRRRHPPRGARDRSRIQDRIGVGPDDRPRRGRDRSRRAARAARVAGRPPSCSSVRRSSSTSICNVVYNVNQVSLRQAITPDRMHGRMNATMRFLVWGTIPIGSLIGAGLSRA